jgi:hypothetical protein
MRRIPATTLDGRAITILVWRTFRGEFDEDRVWHDVPNSRPEYATEDGRSVVEKNGLIQTEDGDLLIVPEGLAPQS